MSANMKIRRIDGNRLITTMSDIRSIIMLADKTLPTISCLCRGIVRPGPRGEDVPHSPGQAALQRRHEVSKIPYPDRFVEPRHMNSGSRRVDRRPNGEMPSRSLPIPNVFHPLTLLKNPRLAPPANPPIQPLKNRPDGVGVGGEDPFFSDQVQVAAVLQHVVHVVVEAAEVNVPPLFSPPLHLVGQHQDARHVDEIDPHAHNQHMPVDPLQRLGHVVHRAEKQRAVDPDDPELGAFHQRLFLQVGEPPPWIVRVGRQHRDVGMGGAGEVERQRQQNPGVNGEFQLEKKRAQKRDRQHRGFASAGFHDFPDVPHVDQLESHHQDDPAHGGKGQIGGQRRDQEQD